MRYNKYTQGEINIGYQVYFDDVYWNEVLIQPNYKAYWKVEGKDDSHLMLSLNKIHYWVINVKDVRQYFPDL